MSRSFAVIFDMDGVLFDSESVYIEGYVKYASDYPDIRETSLSCVGANGRRTREIFMEKYGESFPFDEYYRKVKAYVQSHPIPLKQGAVEILKFLSEKNIPLALASSTSTPSVMKMLDEAQLLPYFDKVICGDTVSHSKPHPEIFLKAAEELGYAPENCYVIEDSYNGIRAAYNAGMIPVMVPDILMPDEEIREKLSYLFPDLPAAQAFFEGLIQ
ncbi:MAG: HAD family phosphatase [Ruminococcus sp.]|nr:HAD family phosphatase [Ruminococcus sp.]